MTWKIQCFPRSCIRPVNTFIFMTWRKYLATITLIYSFSVPPLHPERRHLAFWDAGVEDATRTSHHESECGIESSEGQSTENSLCSEFGCRILNGNYSKYEHLILGNVQVWLCSKPNEPPSCLLYFMAWKQFELWEFDNGKCSSSALSIIWQLCLLIE